MLTTLLLTAYCNTAATLRDNYSYGQTMDKGLLYRNLWPVPCFNNTTKDSTQFSAFSARATSQGRIQGAALCVYMRCYILAR